MNAIRRFFARRRLARELAYQRALDRAFWDHVLASRINLSVNQNNTQP